MTPTDLIRLLVARLEQMTAVARTLAAERDRAEAELAQVRKELDALAQDYVVFRTPDRD